MYTLTVLIFALFYFQNLVIAYSSIKENYVLNIEERDMAILSVNEKKLCILIKYIIPNYVLHK